MKKEVFVVTVEDSLMPNDPLVMAFDSMEVAYIFRTLMEDAFDVSRLTFTAERIPNYFAGTKDEVSEELARTIEKLKRIVKK